MLKTYFQKLSSKAITPLQATPGSVGYDLFMPIDFEIQPEEQKTIFTNIAITPPEVYYVQLMSKSGLTVLYELEVKAGVVDPDFTGNVGVLKNNSDKLVEHVAREQIAQLLFIKVATPMLVQVSSLPCEYVVNMASGHTVQTKRQICKQFRKGLQILLDTFHGTILLYTQNIHVVNFSNISKGFVNVIIMYETEEGRSVKLEALGEIDQNYIHT